ncbi:hypothetical protein SAMN05444166_4787 [Singulisphaera sp. GP187]|uniref:histidinol phosphatase n=1 Tax=Singulisphaera sp. GP187 TaxID=1882752 RepID=UPI00092A093C|nr:histidinol phosphatase [Singulisphaera sp. GP187]SIO44557.1 hypothetical protein SAMN05444166_4787 [Singulisphaera sp. GP187]
MIGFIASACRKPQGLVFLGLIAANSVIAADGKAPEPKYSPVERMAPARLKAAHEDALRIQGTRRTLPPIAGLNDYRAILHAHAEDSAHTGGTRLEMLAEAKRAGVHAILLTDHHRPPKDFITDSWRGIREGVLFVPGSESRGFLIYPTRSIMGRMSDPTPALIQAVRDNDGLIFLSHIEERPEHPMTDLDGMEIYNRHADLKKDKESVAALTLQLTDPATVLELEESLRLYPDEILAAQQTYQADYLAKWDAEAKSRRLTGVAANDCHHYMVLLVTMVDADHVRIGTNVDPEQDRRTIDATRRPGIRAMTKGHQPGDVLARIDLDPYSRSFRNVSTHVLAAELTEPAIRRALRGGHAYVSHDWICDPTGFRFEAVTGPNGSPHALLGDEVPVSPSLRLVAQFPVACRIRLLRDGQVIEDRQSDTLDHAIKEPGVYRVEGWLSLDGEERPWIYANPIYVREAK